MAYAAATDVMRFGWQTKQFVIDPNAQTRTTILDCLAFPSATGVTAEAVTVAEERAEYLAAHPGGSDDNKGY